MKDNTYNGWTSYATWRVQLEIISDYIDAEIERIHEGDTELLDMSDGALADYLKDYVEELVTSESGGELVNSYALAFLNDVNWRELAESAKTTWAEEVQHA
jgi:hypothetical protein